MLANKLLQCAALPAGDLAGAVDLDGTNDYLSRASDFTGNADGKTFTFSAWVWFDDVAGAYYLYGVQNGASDRHVIYISGGGMYVIFYNAAGAAILNINTGFSPASRTMYNVLISVDLANAANRYIYINDIALSPTWTTYTNDTIDFADATNTHFIGANKGALGARCKGRLAHVFLDYQYRDLSVEANRRYFITADRKPAASSSTLTSGIMYFPMDDPTTVHINSGTGGDMTLNGTIARSGRGPNQFNAPYSVFNGTSSRLNITSLTGAADGKQFTFHGSFSTTELASRWLMSLSDGRLALYYSAGSFHLLGKNVAGTIILNVTVPEMDSVALNRNYVLDISIDMSDTAKRHILLDGASTTPTWTTYTNDSLGLSASTNVIGCDHASSSGTYWKGNIGNIFFHTTYIDLSNAANLAKFVTGTGIDAKPVDMGANGEFPLGTTPLIYLPMYGNNAGKNYGSGGDFTVNSGPYTGARGPNEYWGNKAGFAGSTNYLSRTSALTGAADGGTFSCSFILSGLDHSGSSQYCPLWIETTGGLDRFELVITSAGTLDITGRNSSGTQVFRVLYGSAWEGFYQICIDLSDTGKRFLYRDGVALSPTWNTYTNGAINFTAEKSQIHSPSAATGNVGYYSEFYFTTDYIDFSQEANRLKFRDAFGNPVDLTPQIAAGTIPNPAIYMRFDPADQGLNSGTGGNFTKTGTITDGGQL